MIGGAKLCAIPFNKKEESGRDNTDQGLILTSAPYNAKNYLLDLALVLAPPA